MRRPAPGSRRWKKVFRENALSYLLVLRLVPLFPFFVVNLVPAFLGVSLSVYFIGTFLGIIPGSFVFASVGAGLGSIFEAGGDFSAKGILTPQVIIALVGLALLSLIPRGLQEAQVEKRLSSPQRGLSAVNRCLVCAKKYAPASPCPRTSSAQASTSSCVRPVRPGMTSWIRRMK